MRMKDKMDQRNIGSAGFATVLLEFAVITMSDYGELHWMTLVPRCHSLSCLMKHTSNTKACLEIPKIDSE